MFGVDRICSYNLTTLSPMRIFIIYKCKFLNSTCIHRVRLCPLKQAPESKIAESQSPIATIAFANQHSLLAYSDRLVRLLIVLAIINVCSHKHLAYTKHSGIHSLEFVWGCYVTNCLVHGFDQCHHSCLFVMAISARRCSRSLPAAFHEGLCTWLTSVGPGLSCPCAILHCDQRASLFD